MNLPLLASLRHRIAVAALTAAVSACSINYPADASLTSPVNSCSTDADCAAGASCANDRCIGTNVDLSDLIVQVRPNAGASYGASTSFLLPVNNSFAAIKKDAAFDVNYPIELPRAVQITAGTVHLDYHSKCYLDDSTISVPATITFDRVSALAGFRSDSYTVTAEKKSAKSSKFEFDASLLPGKYSVYIQPQVVVPDCLGQPPPVFYPSQDIGAATDGTDWTVIKPTTLGGDIQIPDGGDLTGWRLDIVEPTGGRVISTTQKLQQGMIAFAVNVNLSFVWNDLSVSPYIRLRPPPGEARPSVYWGLIESLSSQSKAEVHLSVANLQIDPREVEIQVQDADNKGVLSSVQIQSVTLSGDVKKNAAYAIEVAQTDAQGVFKLSLPPGTYQFHATPIDDATLATGDIDLVVPPLDPTVAGNPCYCGRVIPVAKKVAISGQVTTPMGEALSGATITLNPSQRDAVNFWKRVVHAIDPRPLAPRSEISATDMGGMFGLFADPGASDLTVTPADQSGFPWLVRPRVQVQAGAGVQLDTLTLPNPALLRGIVTDPSAAPAANVVVEGWLPVHNADGSPPTTVIQIGATTSDENGRYTLILPASISE
ncbi:MAG: carboxypeptidase-like regulatory domain-containing protein [Byssovorax sp.]